MSPDEREVAALIRRASRRGRLVAAAEALAWGAVVAVVSPIAAVSVAVAIFGWRSRSTRDAAVVRALERTHPDARNLFVTAAELASGRLAARPAARDRVFACAAVLARSTRSVTDIFSSIAARRDRRCHGRMDRRGDDTVVAAGRRGIAAGLCEPRIAAKRHRLPRPFMSRRRSNRRPIRVDPQRQ